LAWAVEETGTISQSRKKGLLKVTRNESQNYAESTKEHRSSFSEEGEVRRKARYPHGAEGARKEVGVFRLSAD